MHTLAGPGASAAVDGSIRPRRAHRRASARAGRTIWPRPGTVLRHAVRGVAAPWSAGRRLPIDGGGDKIPNYCGADFVQQDVQPDPLRATIRREATPDDEAFF